MKIIVSALVKHSLVTGLLFTSIAISTQAQPINRKAVVERHAVVIDNTDSLNSLTVGNGAFAFTVDATGLQSFPEHYANGVALGTQSEWAWHSFPNKENYRVEEALKIYHLNGRDISYTTQPKEPARAKGAVEYFRVNEHRLQMGNLGLEITKKDGSPATISDIKNISQKLDPWTGSIASSFTVENVPVKVITVAYPGQDGVAAKIESDLVKQGRLKLRLRYPFPNSQFRDNGVDYSHNEAHTTKAVQQSATGASIIHTLDTNIYYTRLDWTKGGAVTEKQAHYFVIAPATQSKTFEISCIFSPKETTAKAFNADKVIKLSADSWKEFWMSGGAVDFSGSTDKRAFELERRVVLSQYLTRAQCAGKYPPQETGLTYNSWYGKPHLEMYWWHAAHYALWGRTALLEKSLDWYQTVAGNARAIAQRQGFDGIRWQKMTDNEGREAPSSVGAFLIWQQPHFIYLADLVYKNTDDKKVFDKYKDLVFATADFMASFPTFDSATQKYNLGKGLIPAQECFEAVETFNPTYELAYWAWALEAAQQWRIKAGMARNAKWDEVLKNLAPLPEKEGVYLATESTPDCYEPGNRRLNDHPAVLGALSTLPPANGLDTAVMHRTYDLVKKVWHWDNTWGWDFPLVSMAATRLNIPEESVNALFMDVKTNTYLPNGHNYQDDRLTIYLPGNGGVLAAVALMCTGPEGNKKVNPGFPADGTWQVKWEGLKPQP